MDEGITLQAQYPPCPSWRPGAPTNESRRLGGGVGGQMEAGKPPTESRRLVGDGRWWLMWLALQAEGSVWLALQVEGVREPPTSRNDSLGVVVAGIAGGGGERAANES